MSLTLADKTIAILAANGFEENHITAIQRVLTKDKVAHKIIAPEQGLVNGWQNNGWGHYFTVDAQINTALGSDFDALVIVGGERGVAKLKTSLHTRRIVNHFLEARKPIAAIGAGVALLALSPHSAGREVSAPAELHDEIKAAGMVAVDEERMTDGTILTASGADLEAWTGAALVLFSETAEMEQAA